MGELLDTTESPALRLPFIESMAERNRLDRLQGGGIL
jgi:hypothetical protein